MPARLDEYYVIRVKRKPGSARASRQEVFVTDRGLGPVGRALGFDSIEAAEAYIRQHADSDAYTCQIQYCSLLRTPDPDDPVDSITDALMQIPYPYRRTAYNWYRGRDVEQLLRRESDEVYERHRKMLLDYDIDITRPSDVVLIRTRRQRKPDPGPAAAANAPRQYFAWPGQRPRPPADRPDLPWQRQQRDAEPDRDPDRDPEE